MQTHLQFESYKVMYLLDMHHFFFSKKKKTFLVLIFYKMFLKLSMNRDIEKNYNYKLYFLLKIDNNTNKNLTMNHNTLKIHIIFLYSFYKK